MSTNCKCNNCKCGKIETESSPIIVTDNMGREIFWEDMGRKDD
jgi:hypothetical protein